MSRKNLGRQKIIKETTSGQGGVSNDTHIAMGRVLWEEWVYRGIHASKNQVDADELMRKHVDSIDLDYERLLV